MTGLVVDCSVILGHLYPDESLTERESELVQSSDIVAPDLIAYEVGNSVSMSVRKRRIVPERAGELLETFLNLPVETHPVASLTSLCDLAHKHRLTVYDAAYLDLAIRLKVPLLTRDRALADAAAAEGIAA